MTMAENNLNKAIAYLGSSLQTLVQQATGPVDLDQEIREKGSILANNLGRIK